MICNTELYETFLGASLSFDINGKDYDLDTLNFIAGISTGVGDSIFKTKAECTATGVNSYRVNILASETETLRSGVYFIEIKVIDAENVVTSIGKKKAIKIIDSQIKTETV